MHACIEEKKMVFFPSVWQTQNSCNDVVALYELINITNEMKEVK